MHRMQAAGMTHGTACGSAPFGDWGNASLVYSLIQWLEGKGQGEGAGGRG